MYCDWNVNDILRFFVKMLEKSTEHNFWGTEVIILGSTDHQGYFFPSETAKKYPWHYLLVVKEEQIIWLIIIIYLGMTRFFFIFPDFFGWWHERRRTNRAQEQNHRWRQVLLMKILKAKSIPKLQTVTK